MSPHPPDPPSSGEGRTSGPRAIADRAARRLRGWSADVRASVGAMVDDVVAPRLTPATVPVTPAHPRRQHGGGR